MFGKNKDKPPYDVDQIKEGKFLDQAKDASVQQFFKAWMSKRPKKALVGTYFTLREDTEYVYWGRPVLQRLFIDKRIVEKFFRTATAELENQFPNYTKIDGNVVRLKTQKAILESDARFANVSVYSGQFQAQLSEQHIIVEAQCHIRLKGQTTEEGEKKEIFAVVLDKNALALVVVQKR